ncbi:MAG TPA: amidohydrolase family protein [Pyrinomonadaceae bacterium]|nr:amidohydrolase family protein [Pyrinomonadaceae bacterium]HRK50790.1 amidohydrolase family protein [Pyrinomonadaceae bacterium]
MTISSSKINITCFTLGFMILVLAFSLSASAQIAVKGETVWTMAGEPISNGVILVNNGKIEAVGPASQVNIPAGYRVINAKVVTPGLIDAHTVIGLNGYLNQPHDQMALDGGASIQPELRAIDAYNAEEKLVEWVRGFGVTTIHTGHQPSALISGQTMVAKTTGKNVDEATVIPTAMIAVTLGNAANAGAGRSPGSRAKQAAMLRAELIKALENSKKKEPATDLKSAILDRVIKREIPLLITAEAAVDIMTALRIAKEFNIRVVLDGASDGHMLINEIKASGFPVIVHPTMARPGGDRENLSMENAAKLKAAGIPVALQSGYEGYVPKTRVVLFEAAMAAANGMSRRDALATITIDAARILGIDGRVGSIAVGKDADLAMYDGDPFEFITHCIGTMINGKMVSEVIR